MAIVKPFHELDDNELDAGMLIIGEDVGLVDAEWTALEAPKVLRELIDFGGPDAIPAAIAWHESLRAKFEPIRPLVDKPRPEVQL